MRLFALVAIFIFSSNILAYVPISDRQRVERYNQFQYQPNYKLTESIPALTACKPQDISFFTNYPEKPEGFKIIAKITVPEVPNSKLVMTLPPLGGNSSLDIKMAQSFCEQGISTIVILNDFTGLDSDKLVPVDDHNHAPRRVVAAIKGAIKIYQEITKVENVNAGLSGASLGGIMGSIAAGVMPEIKACNFLVSGGDVANILTYSDQVRVIKLKKARMKEQKLKTNEQYEEFLNKNLMFDPLHFAVYIHPENVKLYISKADNSVQSKNQVLLFKALGNPVQTKYFDTSHLVTIYNVLNSTNERKEIADWFFAKLN